MHLNAEWGIWVVCQFAVLWMESMGNTAQDMLKETPQTPERTQGQFCYTEFMRHRLHTCDESQCSFDQVGAEFTLEKIISLDLDKFSDSICGISGAARKELSTEQVQALPLH
ncbi:dynein heavy chain 2, axonemal [Lates japonicus]|uniref:Dynein heavy chain 2, axonemal n=1 Tax=Lates japonicus TaxID=270547 RepID=A0AAD3R051_LATJO|nr:dynein heavy chain 2, axonemal [Lates japonicus]